MKRHISYWMLLCRSTVFKMLALFAAMTAVEAGLFFLRGRNAIGLEQMVDAAWLRWVFGVALIVMTVLLGSVLCESGGKLDYTLRRLRLRRRSLFLWQAVFNFLCLLLLWFVQLFVALLLCRLWMAGQEGVSNQALFLAFYRSDFLHSLLPLEDVSRWVRNVVCFAFVGVASACVPVCHRRGKYNIGGVLQAGWMMTNFSKETGAVGPDVILMTVCGVMTFISFVMAWGDDYAEED